MANVNEFEFHPRIIAALKKGKHRPIISLLLYLIIIYMQCADISFISVAHITDLSHVLSLSASDLVRLTRLSTSDVLVLQRTAANAVPRLPMVTGTNLTDLLIYLALAALLTDSRFFRIRDMVLY